LTRVQLSLPERPRQTSVLLGSGAFSRLKSGRTGLLMRVAMLFW
jgi:hypothetical protein